MRFNFNLLISAVIMLWLTACQKPVDWLPETTPINPPINTTGKLLVKAVGIEGADTSTTVFSYDSNKYLIGQYTTERFPDYSFVRYQRDSIGRITVVTRFDSQSMTDTLITTVFYPNTSTLNALYSTTVFSTNITQVVDSSVFLFNGDNLLKEMKNYMPGPSGVSSPVQYSRFEYNYANNNLVNQKIYFKSDSSSVLGLSVTILFTYDNKINPFSDQNIQPALVGSFSGYAVNNITKLDYISDTLPAENSSQTLVYIYNSDNLPLSVIATDISDNTFSNTTFYYQ